MFNIFRDEGEQIVDRTQVQKIFWRVQHAQLQDRVKYIEVIAELDVITYSEAANHPTSAVSKIREYQLYQAVSDIQTSGGDIGGNRIGNGTCKGGNNSGSIYNSQGNIQTGYYQNWKVLSKEYHKNVITTRKKNGSKYIYTAIKKDVSDTNRQLSECFSTLTEMKACIATFSGNYQGNKSSKASSGQKAPVS